MSENQTSQAQGEPRAEPGTGKQAEKKIETKEIKIEKLEKIEHKELKIEKIEIKEHKDLKSEKLEKNEVKEHKDAKQEKLEKNEAKEHKDAKQEKLEKNEIKEHKDAKLEKLEHKEISKIEVGEKPVGKEKDGKEIAEGPTGNGGDPLGQRVSALEQSMASLQHFITSAQRPDLSRGALSGESRGSSSGGETSS